MSRVSSGTKLKAKIRATRLENQKLRASLYTLMRKRDALQREWRNYRDSVKSWTDHERTMTFGIDAPSKDGVRIVMAVIGPDVSEMPVGTIATICLDPGMGAYTGDEVYRTKLSVGDAYFELLEYARRLETAPESRVQTVEPSEVVIAHG